MISGPDIADDQRPVAVGGNCGVGASDTLFAILSMTEAEPEAVIVCKANAGIPVVKGEHVHYSGSAELMGEYAGLAIDAGARIIGGCCGTKPTLRLRPSKRMLVRFWPSPIIPTGWSWPPPIT